MASVQLKEEVWQEGIFTYHDGTEVTVRYRFKDKLMARTCDHCGKVFQVPIKDTTPMAHTIRDATIMLTMDKYHPSHAGTIHHDICSTECGHKLVEGMWKHMKHDPMDEDGSHPFVAIGAEVKSFRMNVRNDLLTRADLLKSWEIFSNMPVLTPDGGRGREIGVAGEVRIISGSQNNG